MRIAVWCDEDGASVGSRNPQQLDSPCTQVAGHVPALLLVQRLGIRWQATDIQSQQRFSCYTKKQAVTRLTLELDVNAVLDRELAAKNVVTIRFVSCARDAAVRTLDTRCAVPLSLPADGAVAAG